MQYVASSFSEMLVGLFEWALRARRVTPPLDARFPGPTRFACEVPEPVLDGVVPIVERADRSLAPVRALQRGPVHMYVLYVLVAVVVALVVARRH